jgi:epoxyqueuosine reductase
MNYDTERPYSTEVAENRRGGWIARYAWSKQDYHDVLISRLQLVESKIRASAQRHNVGELVTRCYVDTGPHVERVYAKYAGVGWIGKNTCILNEKLGSWIFLGIILTSLELVPDLPAEDRCTRCIAACPTQALVEPYKLDATRCISYLTIEKRGAIPLELRTGVGNHLFGCDICQDVCPWNDAHKAAGTRGPFARIAELEPREELINPALDWLAEMTREQFQRAFKGSPVKRAKHSGLRRNAAVAMGNSRRKEFGPTLKQLAKDEDPVVAEHARWALERLERS